MIKKFLSILLLIPTLVFGATATFTQDTSTTYINPERGWYIIAKDSEMTVSALQSFVSTYQTRLILYNINLDAYQGTDTIPGSYLTTINGYFAQARTAGVKLVVIVSYGANETNPTTPVARMVLHAQQLQATFKTNRDIIAFVKAGFIGAFGEWSDPNATLSMKTQVRDAVMGMVPVETMVEISNSYVQLNWFPAALTAAQAFQGSTQARMGFHNDCFLSGPTDAFQFPGQVTVGGFTPNPAQSQLQQRQYMQTISEYVPYGAETSVDSCDTPTRINCPTASGPNSSNPPDGAGQTPTGVLPEGARSHLAWMHYPGESDNTTLLAAWTDQGCLSTVANMMGYRLGLDAISHPDSVSAGATAAFTLGLHNYGWSRFFFDRRPTITLIKSGSANIVCTSANDLRKLPSQTTTPTQMRINCAIPSGTSGSYAVWISFPDKTPTLSTIRFYMVRPANVNNGGQTWDDTNGRFATGTSITVSP